MGGERREEICTLLSERGNLSVTELAEHFSVSEMTIRRDLKALAVLGLVQREHGRAVFPPQIPPGDLFWTRLGEAEKEKLAIGRLAAQLVGENESIILDAGTTTLAVAQALKQRCVVITNSLPIAGLLGRHPEKTVILTGGELRGETSALVGPLVRSGLQGMNADKLFLAATGVSVEKGLSTANMLESEVKQAMLHAAKEVILVAHSTKIGKVFYHTFTNWDNINTLVTDARIPPATRSLLEERGIKVLTAT